ncbi:MAG: hypothetical protein QNJ55_28675 [Xenococcus sp. MO_188.B8]|nr:hypothetical protein [Xenococcus sp. MO_188.B8]
MSKQTNKKTSKFNSLLNAAKKTDDEEVVSSPESNSDFLPVEAEENPVLTEIPSTVKKGRPKGKRSNPDFEQVTAYLRKQTYRETKIALLQLGESQDFSELVEKLLTEWLSTQKRKNSKT